MAPKLRVINGGRRVNSRATTCCDGTCNQGRSCPLVPARGPTVVRMPAPRMQLGGAVSRTRRVRSWLSALFNHLTSPCWKQ